MTKIVGKASVATMAIDEAWRIINAEWYELSADERAKRRQLLRRYREHRPPFARAALKGFFARGVDALLAAMGG